MTNSKEALDNLVHCKSITRCKECRHKSLCTMERDFNIIKQDLDRLEKLEKENQELRKAIKQWNISGGNLLRENAKLKKVIGILEKRLGVKIKVCINGGCSISILVNDRLITPNNEYLKYIDEEEYELLKEVLGNVKD